jgi:ribonuclease Z
MRFASDPSDGDFTALPRHSAERDDGRNVPQRDGLWTNIYSDAFVSVSAAPIQHSVPCVGYVIEEAPIPGKMNPALYLPHIKRTKSHMSVLRQLQAGETVELSDGTVLHGPERRPGRKLTILGDTYDPSPIAKLALGSDLLIHEATNAHLPGVDPGTKDDDTFESVQARTMSRGHSTPQMAGLFGKAVAAQKLALNHFSARYPGDDDKVAEAKAVMDAIAELARKNFDGPVICARDFMSFDVEHRAVESTA